MNGVYGLPGELVDMVRLALREQVYGAEPSAETWVEIRRRILATAGDRVNGWWTRRLHLVQVVAVVVVLLGVGISAGLYQRPAHSAESSSPVRRTSVAGRRDSGGRANDHLSGRLIWRGLSEPQVAERVLRRGLLE